MPLPFNSLLLALAFALGLSVELEASPILARSASVAEDPKREFEIRFEQALGDVEALWALHSYCEENELRRLDRKLCREIIKLDGDHAGARAALGHIWYDEQWFTNQKKFAAHKRRKEKREGLAKGWVPFKDTWVDPVDLPNLEAGLVKDVNGNWMTPDQLKYQAEGWVQVDLEWLSPEEQLKAKSGLYKCAGEWLELEAANEFHSVLESPWTMVSENGEFIYRGTLERSRAEEALALAAEVKPHMLRLFGRMPTKPANLVVLRSAGQYGAFMVGGEGLPPKEGQGYSSLYGACLADLYFDREGRHMGAGAAYWDAEAPSGDIFGRLFVRHAAGLAIVEALDPSPKALKRSRGPGQLDLKAFYKEKQLPRWLRYGAASYVERYRLDPELSEGADSLRKWAISNIERRGPISSVSTILDMGISVEDPDSSNKLISEAGLLVAFILDGSEPQVSKAHASFRKAFMEGRTFKQELKYLEGALKAASTSLITFAQQ